MGKPGSSQRYRWETKHNIVDCGTLSIQVRGNSLLQLSRPSVYPSSVAFRENRIAMPLRDDVTRDVSDNSNLTEKSDKFEIIDRPARIGRYAILDVLGQGGFGRVYLAQDDQLDRLVAIKVPHVRLIASAIDAQCYLTEARNVASLDHPFIVPVFDVGSSDVYPCYIVSKYIKGTNLSERLNEGRLDYQLAIELVANVAEALHYAHKNGLVHRDIKPSNLMLDSDGNIFIVDFGLALREENLGRGAHYVGTPSYMSPEQARGEGHRVDGRSDVFSLGVVLYELLTGKRPFRGESDSDLRLQVTTYEPRPLRQTDESIPLELERICAKAIAKRSSERYSTAKDFADDLRHVLSSYKVKSPAQTQRNVESLDTRKTTPQPTPNLTSGDSGAARIVPKGLRSFDAHDADFFLELLPGPRDRDGIPESLRFWKTNIEEIDPNRTFSVGVLYGPSGCGKSSLVKAGLLPRLSTEVFSLYVEATPDETKSRLLHGLHRRCPSLQHLTNLKDVLAEIRRGKGIPEGKKVLIVLDQFEQWLHAQPEDANDELVQALRQCDGGRVQCLLLVRDDFWLAVSRFLRELEVQLLEGKNSLLVDLFDSEHAAKVLTSFGRAFGRLPENAREISREQKDFLQQSVRGLSENGKVICVRLSLFAEMMKSRPWTMASLNEVGGTQGVGVTFLEENFSVASASPEHRFHQSAARAILNALLPESGTDIKGVMKSHQDLLDVSGYANRVSDFDDLIKILDKELRLITPTDPFGINADDSVSREKFGSKCYQLSHDYLVHSVRDWINRKQKETRRGRAEILLAEHAKLWNVKRQNRLLPSFLEHAAIRLNTSPSTWTEPQRLMMKSAGRLHGIRSCLWVSVLAILLLGGWGLRSYVVRDRLQNENRLRAEGLVEALLSAEINQVPGLVAEISRFQDLADPLLIHKGLNFPDDSTPKLHAALALLSRDERQCEYIAKKLPALSMDQFSVACDALLPHQARVSDGLWELVEDEQLDTQERFQAACALAKFTPDHQLWPKVAPWVTDHLISVVPTLFLGQRLQQLRPVKPILVDSLIAAYRERASDHVKQRVIAATALADYLNDQPQVLAELILDAEGLPAYSPLIDALKPHAETIRPHLWSTVTNKIDDATDLQSETLLDTLQKRQAMAAVTLVQLGFGELVWPLLELSPNPTLRSFIVRDLGRLQTDARQLSAQLAVNPSVSVRRALIQVLGAIDVTRVPSTEKQRIIDQLIEIFKFDEDAGTHSAAQWALHRWGATTPELPIGIPRRSDAHERQLATLKAKVTQQEEKLANLAPALEKRQIEWEHRLITQSPDLVESLTKELVAHFPLDEIDQSTFTNVVPSQLPAVLEGSGSLGSVPGVNDRACEFSGTNGYINAGLQFSPERSDTFSYGCWFVTDKQPPMALLAKMEPPEKDHRGFDILVYQGRIQAHLKHVWPTDVIKVVANIPVDDGIWHHVFVCYDGSSKASGLRVFIDGTEALVEVIIDNLRDTIRNQLPLIIGSRGFREHFVGGIDDVRIYNRTLTSAEVKQLFDSGIANLARINRTERSSSQHRSLEQAYRPLDETLKQVSKEVRASNRELREGSWAGIRHWHVNSQGQTFVIIPNPTDVGNRSINYSFEIGISEVTIEQFLRFRPNQAVDSGAASDTNCPMHMVSWYDAVEYCNWLNVQEGIPQDQWCYLPNDKQLYSEGMVVVADNYQRTGYRLPNALEWESACRATTTTRYCFGRPLELLDRYGWHGGNAKGQSYPVCSLLPNDLGLFDMHGNLWEWCQDEVGSAEAGIVNNRLSRRLRGGAFSINRGMTSRAVTSERPIYRGNNIGFRLTRTLPQ